ncbi:MAG: RagB/SusD family nutrient uptake outer membrane protein [Tannerella sp.]|nr:RagB/SusD family nutrient uptake outer membrane protein [Tannerella sp.]
MKNFIKITAISAMVMIAVSSCNEEYLERYPLTSISDGDFWKSSNDLKLYVNGLYSREDLLPSRTGFGTIGIYGLDADEGSDTQVWDGYNTRFNGEGIVPETGGGWNADAWLTLRRINYFMDHYPAVEALTSFDEVKQYVGEALFFRSLFYFNKLRSFGNLPWASTTLTATSDVLFESRLPRNQVVDSIMFDLDRAVEYLPAYSSYTGRVSRETAMALQARIALYEGTWEKYHDGTAFAAASNQSQKFLQKAADVAGALITLSESSGYPALDNVGVENGYRDLFNQSSYANSREVFFWRRYEVGVIATNWHRYSDAGAGRGITKSLIDSYLKADGTPVASGYDDSNLPKVVEGRDPRLIQTVHVTAQTMIYAQASPPRYFIAPQLEGAPEALCPTGYQLQKGHDYRWSAGRPAEQGTTGQIYFRFGETLLIYAEAKAELGAITQADLDRSINKLRDRVGMPHLTTGVAGDPTFEFADLPPVIQAIRRERKVELACEGFRNSDIMRWAAADELIAGKIPVGAKKAQWNNFNFEDYLPESTWDVARQNTFTTALDSYQTDAGGYIKPFGNRLNGGTEGFKFNLNRDYLLPIPSNELRLNTNLGQNPGW